MLHAAPDTAEVDQRDSGQSDAVRREAIQRDGGQFLAGVAPSPPSGPPAV